MQKNQYYKIALILILIVNPVLGQSSEADTTNVKHHIIGYDKIQHTAVSCLLTLSGQYILEQKANLAQNETLCYSASTTAIIGLTKELNDMKINLQPFNWGDMVANIFGIGLAILIISL